MLSTFFVMLVIFSMYKIGNQYLESVTNISNLSPTHLVSKIRHQHRCNRNPYLEKHQSQLTSKSIVKIINMNLELTFGHIFLTIMI